MTRTRALLGTGAFLILAPGTFSVLIPWLISGWRMQPPFFGLEATRWVGFALIVIGLPVLLDSFVRFALEGLGTPSPAAPPEHLVVRGPYRYVRNPMYLAVVAITLGEGFVLGNSNVVWYALIAWLITHVFVVSNEEPTLRKTFGEEYRRYCEHVDRWIPRRGYHG